jgi:hypothetical protein
MKAQKAIASWIELDPVRVGFLSLDELSQRMVKETLPSFTEYMQNTFPEFKWIFEAVALDENPAEPVKSLPLLDKAYLMMLDKGWDFCLLSTSRRLDPGESRSGWMKLSISHSAALVSLHRLLPLMEEMELAQKIYLDLLVEAFGRLNGLKKGKLAFLSRERETRVFAAEEKETMARHLREVADVRPQERLREASRAIFYLRVTLRHPWWIIRATLSHRPWSIVYRSTRLIFAALAAMALSVVTMEFWDLAVSQNIWRTLVISALVIVLASLYVIWKHRLLALGNWSKLSEQNVVFNVSSILTIFLGFALLFATIFIFTLLLTSLLFPKTVLSKWLMVDRITSLQYARVSLLISCLSLLVGALGAGLEDSDYFRYLLYGG